VISLNKSKVMQEVSRSLGDAVAAEMEAQFNPAGSSRSSRRIERQQETVQEQKTVIFK
jgi:hypothetical protein